MIDEAALAEMVRDAIGALGGREEDGEEFREPSLEILAYHARAVRLNRWPWLGRASSVVALAREPDDFDDHAKGLSNHLRRVANATNARFGPWRSGPTIGLTVVSIARTPIVPGEERLLAQTLAQKIPRSRVIPLGLFRVEPEREALSFSLVRGPAGLFKEPEILADVLSEKLRRFVSNIDAES